MKIKSLPLSTALAFCLTAGMVTARSAQPQTQVPGGPDCVVSTRTEPAAPAISSMLKGSQFNFFDPAIKLKQLKSELLDDWKSAKIGALRYPGGTWGDHYVWDHPEKSYFVANASADTIITPAEFIAICRKTGAEPIFQANALVRGGASNNWINPTKIENIREGARWTAGWVRQANIVNGWKVKYWEIGNELWIMYRPEEYATVLSEYSKAMKAVDPTIKIIACGLSGDVGPFSLEWFNFKDDPNWKLRLSNSNTAQAWNKALFTLAKGRFDFLAPHPYIEARDLSGKDLKDSREIYLQTTARVWDQVELQSQYDFLRRYGSTAKIAVTEWSTNFRYSVPVQHSTVFPQYFYSQGNGVNSALYLGRILQNKSNQIAVLHSLDSVQTFWFWPKNAISEKALPHPNYLAFKLWNTHLGTRRNIAVVTKQPMMKIGDKSYPSTFTFASEDAKNIYLVAINLNLDKPQRFRWRPQNTKIAPRGVLSLLAGKSLDADNWATWNEETHEIDIRDRAVATQNGAFNFELPACSVAGITVPKTN